MSYVRENKAPRFVISLALLLLLEMAAGRAAGADWKSEWEKTLQAAKKEGQVTIYFYRYGRVLEAFQREHPEIKVVSVTGRGSQLTTRIIADLPLWAAAGMRVRR